MPGGKPVDYYEISMRQIRQQILPAGLPATTVWGYGAVKAASKQGTPAPPRALAHHRGPLEAAGAHQVDQRPVDTNGSYLPHLLPVDPTLHWANPPGGATGRDTRPTFDATPGRYTGPVPIVTHLHGAAGVGDESDGYAEAWFLPRADDIPAGYATAGTWYDFFKGKALQKFGVAWGAGYATFQYPNDQRESTLWYHDHALGMTRLNVYAGPAGFFLVRGGPEGEKAVLDSRTGAAAVLPGPAPIEVDAFPSNKTYYEIPIAIQDRSFDANGSLFYPDTRAFFDGITGPYIPTTDVSPMWNPEFFGNTIMVNGNTWPFQTVQQRRYRFRLLNGCQSRFLILDFSQIPGVEVWQIGNEGGFLAAPVNLTADNGNRLLLGLAERADLVVDFTDCAGGAPCPGERRAGRAVRRRSPGSGLREGRSREHRPGAGVPRRAGGRARSHDAAAVPEAPAADPADRWVDPAAGAAGADVGALRGRPRRGPAGHRHRGPESPRTCTAESRRWMDPVTENPTPGATEVWEYYNATADAHPMHIHEVLFQVVNRQGLALDDEGEVVQPIQVVGTPTPPEPGEIGWKDTVIAYPGQVTRLRMRFVNPGQFVWHCHIVEHEDNEMMRPYRIGPVQPGQPWV